MLVETTELLDEDDVLVVAVFELVARTSAPAATIIMTITTTTIIAVEIPLLLARIIDTFFKQNQLELKISTLSTHEHSGR